VLVSVFLSIFAWRTERQRQESEFRHQVTSYLNSLRVLRNGAEDILRTFRALFYQNPNLSRSLFTNTVMDLSIRLEGMRVVAWAPRVLAEQRATLEQRMRAEGFVDFQIVEGDLTHYPEDRPVAAGARTEYFPLTFVEPLAGNELALGYDLLAEPNAADLVRRACEQGQVELSAPVRLPARGGIVIGVLAATPVYSRDFLPVLPEERRKQLIGCVLGIFVLDDLLAAVEKRAADAHLDVMLTDETDPADRKLMGIRVVSSGANSSRISPESFRSKDSFEQKLNIGGRDLVFTFRRGANWQSGPGEMMPAAVLGVGLAMTGMLALLLRASVARTSRIEAIVHTRTAELAQANSKLQTEVRDRLDAQNLLARERNLLLLLLNQLPAAVFVTDRQENYLLANRAHLALLGAPEGTSVIGKAVSQVGLPALATALGEELRHVLQSGTPVLSEEKAVMVPGQDPIRLEVTKLPFRDSRGEIDGLLVISRDVTAQKQAEAEKVDFERRLQETQKLESLGILAGGIAHDFNNLLTAILGNANLARMEIPEHSPAIDNLRQIENTSLRAADLCKQMLAYSGKGRFVVRPLDLTKLVEQSTELLRLSISKKATLSCTLAPKLPPVTADATQLQQILMNLVINASEALGNESGYIRISTGSTRVDGEYLHQVSRATEIAAGDYVYLEVSDTGCGMSSETQARIFDPFFTTKFTGRGLGLAAVLGIVRGHRGAITVRSEPGKGSTFRLLLPITSTQPIPEEEPVLQAPADNFKGTLLVVDDEASVRSTACRVLERAGFTVHEADHGLAAVERFALAPEMYRAVLLDLTMPRMDGQETFRALRRLRPKVRVLVMSGFSTHDVLNRFEGDPPGGFIQKPFHPQALLDALANLLNGRA
jgi:PAS domain S-box-containing protein